MEIYIENKENNAMQKESNFALKEATNDHY